MIVAFDVTFRDLSLKDYIYSRSRIVDNSGDTSDVLEAAIRISTGTPTPLTIFVIFLTHSLEADAAMLPQNRPRHLPYTFRLIRYLLIIPPVTGV